MGDLLEKGSYAAQSGANGAVVAFDEYTIEKHEKGKIIKSENTVLGEQGFYQSAELITDNNWKPVSLLVKNPTMNLELNAEFKQGEFSFKQVVNDNVIEKSIKLINNNFILFYSGALVIPFIWLRAFDFNCFNSIEYQIIPVGRAEVLLQRQADDINTRNFNIQMTFGQQLDSIDLITDLKGRLIHYQSNLTNTIIKLKDEA